MEDELDDIANGARTYKKTLSDFYTPFLKEIKEKLFIYMDEDDEVLDSKKTAEVFKDFYVKLFKGGNHSFAHMPELIADFKNSPGNNF